MELSAKAQYALVALIELAAVHGQPLLLQSGDIAGRQGIPDRYLEQVLAALRRGGLLEGIRGPRGGYRLARPPSQINLDQVLACLEGERPGMAAAERTSAEFSVVDALDQRLALARTRILSQTRLDQLLEERQSLTSPQPMFFI
ncbi:MAG: Rrf2 family transcriptional regulator [Chitinophagaceae bacterium]|nr:Rrf2 family transcriptional regulator [Chitinophagaceae bacterium]